MPKQYESVCINCGKSYKGRGRYFCSSQCSRVFVRGGSTDVHIENLVKAFDQFLPYLEDITRVKVDKAIVCADMHAPKTDIEMFNRLIQIASIYLPKPRTIFIVGDLFDFESISKFDPVSKDTTVDDDFKAGQLLIHLLAQTFDKIFWTCGNHDLRLMRKLDYFLNISTVGEILLSDDRLTVSPYPYMEVVSKGIEFLLVHPKDYSRHGKVPVDLAIKYRKSVLSFHGHLFSIRCDPSSMDIGYDVGGMSKPDLHPYMRYNCTTHPIWTSGFCMLYDGSVFPFTSNPKITNWDWWLDLLPSRLKKGKMY